LREISLTFFAIEGAIKPVTARLSGQSPSIPSILKGRGAISFTYYYY